MTAFPKPSPQPNLNPLPRRSLLATAVALTLGWAAQAQAKVLRFILPNATGSGVDAITGGAQNALAKALGSAVVVDKQAGAGGIVGRRALARAPADGSTLSVVSNNGFSARPAPRPATSRTSAWGRWCLT